MSFTKTVFVIDNILAATAADNTLSMVVNDSVQDAGDASSGGTAVLAAGNTFQILEKRYGTPVLNFDDITDVKYSANVDGTEQAHTCVIGLNTDNDSAYIKLIDTTGGRQKFDIATFEVVGQASITAAGVALKALINASTHAAFEDVAVTESSGTITITSGMNQILRVASNAEAGAITETQVPVFTVGTQADVEADFETSLPYLGVTNLAGTQIRKIASGASGTYHKYTVSLKSTVGMRRDTHEVVIYADVGDTAALKTELDFILPVV